MIPEQTLYFSDNCFGTADSISFRHGTLRIHDLKTGETPAHMEQLEIYAALFCLEYDIDPSDIDIILRIYQSNEITELEADSNILLPIMDKIIVFDKIIMDIRAEEG